MSTNPKNSPEYSDEIDMGQILKLFSRISNSIFQGILAIFIFLKRNIIWFAVVLFLGLLTGFILNNTTPKLQKIDVIVTPNVTSSTYLNDIVSELQSDLRAKDTAFFKNLGVDIGRLEVLDIEITPLRTLDPANQDSEMKFLELLKDFGNSPAIESILRTELQEKTTKDQRITFYFSDKDLGAEYAQKILDYINANSYYSDLLKVLNDNAKERITKNDSIIRQIDILIENYSQKILTDKSTSEGRLVLDNQESLDIPSLIELKNNLVRDTELKKVELESREQAVTIVNFGQAYQLQKPFLLKNMVFYPLIFIAIFLLISLIVFLNRKAIEKDSQN
ncbi:hypothetical protein [Muriicola soli]|uniref:Uncharacterized protein n=1 Tax=Muriicola soli TaxID=2507538 RepID=A0A411ECC8_9FLAO|nr:hypothetical protein [Muriicola soli]QBA65391.1 hypothetical protein EQY75_13130 [Muriicola soli]